METPGLKVYVSTLNFGLKSLTQLGDLSRGGRFSNVEIASGHPFEPGLPDWLMKQHEQGVSLLLHNYAPPEPSGLLVDLSEKDKKKRATLITYLKESIALTWRLGADYFSFHGGYRVPFRFGVRAYSSHERCSRKEALSRYIDTFREVLSFAQAKGVHLGVENHVTEVGNEENLILDRPEDYRLFFDSIRSPFAHLHLDTGHLQVSSRVLGFGKEAFVEEFAEKIIGVHLHDNDYVSDRHEAFSEGWWFLDALRKLTQLRYATLETATKEDIEQIEHMSGLLQHAGSSLQEPVGS